MTVVAFTCSLHWLAVGSMVVGAIRKYRNTRICVLAGTQLLVSLVTTDYPTAYQPIQQYD